jgi:pimeloyl-ACP methyl ester carboxylesterase
MNTTPASTVAPAFFGPAPGQDFAGHPAARPSRNPDISTQVALLMQARMVVAWRHTNERIHEAWQRQVAGSTLPRFTPSAPWELWASGTQYAVDFAQRSLSFWDTLRQRGNNFIEHERQGLPPVLRFGHEMVMDGRSLHPPVNYALLRIVPPEGMVIDDRRRPYLIIDPRGGHGPGIGGFKDDSQVGVALRAGHPVYFVMFFRDPEPGQTLLDVCNAEREFVRRVRTLHPDAPKPAIVGNCQGGWAAMMLAAASPDDTGPVVVVGAPMSYWGGAWREAAGDNPMRYVGGLLGGTWLASLTADLGAGTFDGAWLVQNFENLNPANTFWDKYVHLFANIDTETDRFLGFERWWGGYYLLDQTEIEWITQNLFVGNRLWAGNARAAEGGAFDLRDLKAPIVLFASLGDNITPPQQAFNWVADVYRNTDDIKLNGQVIVGLMHEDIGHLGIFVSGQVAKREHAQIVSVLQSIEALPPGLYAMRIAEGRDDAGRPCHDVSFVELELEDVVKRLNRFEREDERPFEAVDAVSRFNQRAYEWFGRPLVRSLASEERARLQRIFHPLRWQRWALSDLNPWMCWLAPAAQMAKARRQAVTSDHPGRRAEAFVCALVSASLDGGRAVRDAAAEACFFQFYGTLHALGVGGERKAQHSAPPANGVQVDDALARIAQGGYPEALARVAYLMAHEDKPLPLSRLRLARDLIEDYHGLLPDLPPTELRRIGGMQEVIARHRPAEAIETLPTLLNVPQERERLLTLLDRVLADKRVQSIRPTAAQQAMLQRIREVLGKAAPLIKPARRATAQRRVIAGS